MGDEKKLLEDIKNDPVHFAVVFDTWHKPIFNYIFRRVADHDLANDIASETFLKAFLHIHSFTWKNISLSCWLYRIATNETNVYFRKKKYTATSLDLLLDKREFFESLKGDNTTPKELSHKELSLHDEYILIRHHLGTMDVKYQEVIALRFFEKKSILEISKILDKKEGTVKSLLSRGLQKLRDLVIAT